MAKVNFRMILKVLAAIGVIGSCVAIWLTNRYVGGKAALALAALIASVIAGWMYRFGNTALGWFSPKSYPELLVATGTNKSVRFVCISDTHCRHENMKVPDGDVLLCAGDFTIRGTVKEIESFNTWLGTLPHKHKIVIAGNHDLILDGAGYSKHWAKHHKQPEENYAEAAKLLSNCTYVLDGLINVEGVKVYGSPHQPELHNMAFNLKRGEELRQHWQSIPADTDILITHGPPQGFGDRILLGWGVGDADLLTAIRKVRPAFHVCGHIHESRGVTHDPISGTVMINAANCNLNYRASQPILSFDFVFDKHSRAARLGEAAVSASTSASGGGDKKQ